MPELVQALRRIRENNLTEAHEKKMSQLLHETPEEESIEHLPAGVSEYLFLSLISRVVVSSVSVPYNSGKLILENIPIISIFVISLLIT